MKGTLCTAVAVWIASRWIDCSATSGCKSQWMIVSKIRTLSCQKFYFSDVQLPKFDFSDFELPKSEFSDFWASKIWILQIFQFRNQFFPDLAFQNLSFFQPQIGFKQKQSTYMKGVCYLFDQLSKSHNTCKHTRIPISPAWVTYIRPKKNNVKLCRKQPFSILSDIWQFTCRHETP